MSVPENELFVVWRHDDPQSTARETAAVAHRAYFARFSGNILSGGVLYDDSRRVPQGSFIVCHFPNLVAARAFAENDPFTLAGLFLEQTVYPFEPKSAQTKRMTGHD
ncbi:YciI family protein [Streptomyces albidoflavus]|uniref:YciI family protein n=1 Tax=Streptomyces albidoflavus TaxID=1886 RepID=UPI003430BFCD